MRFLLGIIIGISIAVGAALLHDNNVPRTPPRTEQQLANLPIVDWEVLGRVVSDQVAEARRWWDSLLGRGEPAPRP